MSTTRITIVDGPLKPDVQWAVTYPEKDLRIHFETEGDPVDVHVDRTEELGDGTSFGLTGHVASSNHRGKRFKASITSPSMARSKEGSSISWTLELPESQPFGQEGRATAPAGTQMPVSDAKI